MNRAYQCALAKPGLSFSQAMGNSFRQTIAGLFSDPRMSESAMLEGHLQATLARAKASEGPYLVAAQDTTFFNYSSHEAMAGLGNIQGQIKGIMQHNVLLMSETGLPLGLLHQQYWSRDGGQDFVGPESLKWSQGLTAVNQHLGQSDKRVVVVQDREADIFAFFTQPRANSVDLLVRVHQPRKLELRATGELVKLPALGERLAVLGYQQVDVLRAGKVVRLRLSLQASGVQVWPHKDRSAARYKTGALGLVIAREVGAVDEQGQDVFQPEQAACWYLLSSLPMESQADIERIVHFYSLRWRIERFHYLLKSGALQVEKLQFDDLATMINALAFYSVVAWQVLHLMYWLRQESTSSARVCFEPAELAILQQVSKRELTTVGQATLALGQLVGFAPSRKQPMPGLRVLSQAWERFHYIKIGYGLTSG